MGLQEGEIKQGIDNGGHLRTVIVVSKCVGQHTEHLAYVRASWKRDLLPLRTWGDRGERTYRDLDRLLVLIRRDFGYHGVIPVYIAGDPDLERYKALAQEAGLQGITVPPHCNSVS